MEYFIVVVASIGDYWIILEIVFVQQIWLGTCVTKGMMKHPCTVYLNFWLWWKLTAKIDLDPWPFSKLFLFDPCLIGYFQSIVVFFIILADYRLVFERIFAFDSFQNFLTPNLKFSVVEGVST